MTRLLIIGGSGQLGLELRRAALPDGWRCDAPSRDALDLGSLAHIEAAVRALRPNVIVNAAAYTAVDKAESEPEAAFALNRDAPTALAQIAALMGVPLVHVSTDYVFDGTSARAYAESDATAPLGVYGASKLAGEDTVLGAQAHAAVVRTSWVFSAHRSNFVKTMLRLSETLDEVGVVADQRGRPTSAADLARACVALADRLRAGDADARGVFHFANAGETTWADFAGAIFEGARRRGHKGAAVKRITTAEYPTPAKRPANSRLDTAKIEALGITPRPWRAALSDVLDELLA
ncbi:MAG: dTDP-4-dehydrorhamnose reductase [Terricaulis sp.]